MQQNNTRRTQEIIYFNSMFSLNVKINVLKNFMQSIDMAFPPANKLYKMAVSNTVKRTQ